MNLTDEQKTALNVGLATWEGWKRSPFTGGNHDEEWWCIDNDSGLYRTSPNYLDPLTGLSHIHRLEERLTEGQMVMYAGKLQRLVNLDWRTSEATQCLANSYTLHASAEQRAIALCRTLSINIEGVTQ